jgi:2-dehydro-3-deoxyphosphogluconate aldolase/(4S)-4-hydroxy-2-oxoglutarate aldolase
MNPSTNSKSSALETLDRLRALRAVAVVRARDPEEAVAVADALFSAGLEAIELTFTTPGIERAFPEVRRRLGPRLLLGAGTITTLEQLRVAVEAGADFLVSPHLDPALLETMLASDLLSLPGVLTPSEVASALSLGADAIKLFPASTVGPEHLKALFGPFPGLQVVPTGGITIASAGTWLAAGAVCVGLGGELLPKGLRDAGAWEEISANASRLLNDLPSRSSN